MLGTNPIHLKRSPRISKPQHQNHHPNVGLKSLTNLMVSETQSLKFSPYEAEGKAQWLRALASFSEDPGLISITHMTAFNVL